MAQTQLVELNHRHMLLAEYILANPAARLKEIAAAVGMSVSWVSIVTNSDIFREHLQRRNREISDVVHLSLQEKVAGVAHLAVEKLGEALENSQDPAFVLAAADKTLQRLGYGAKGAQVQVNTGPAQAAPTTHVDVTIINQAREKVYALAGQRPGGGATRDHEMPSPASLPPSYTARLGQVIEGESGIYSSEEEASGQESPGCSLREESLGAPGSPDQSADSTLALDQISGNGDQSPKVVST